VRNLGGFSEVQAPFGLEQRDQRLHRPCSLGLRKIVKRVVDDDDVETLRCQIQILDLSQETIRLGVLREPALGDVEHRGADVHAGERAVSQPPDQPFGDPTASSAELKDVLITLEGDRRREAAVKEREDPWGEGPIENDECLWRVSEIHTQDSLLSG